MRIVSANTIAVLVLLLLLVFQSSAAADGKEAKLVQAQWRAVTDNLGCRWDPCSYGTIQYGQDHVFSSAMRLRIANSWQFNASSSLMTPDGSQYVLTPNASYQGTPETIVPQPAIARLPSAYRIQLGLRFSF